MFLEQETSAQIHNQVTFIYILKEKHRWNCSYSCALEEGEKRQQVHPENLNKKYFSSHLHLFLTPNPPTPTSKQLKEETVQSVRSRELLIGFLPICDLKSKKKKRKKD